MSTTTAPVIPTDGTGPLPIPNYYGMSEADLATALTANINNWFAATNMLRNWGAAVGADSAGECVLPDGKGGTLLAPTPQRLVQLFQFTTPSVGLFKNLPTTSVPAAAVVIETTGFYTTDFGRARYVDATGQTLAPSGKGIWWNVDATGRQWKLSADTQYSPLQFGATCDGTSDDSKAIQAAHDYIYATGNKGQLYLRGKHYTCLSQINVQPAVVGLSGEAAWLDFSKATYFADPAASPEICTDPTFGNGQWQNAASKAGQTTNWTFSSGLAEHDIPGETFNADGSVASAGPANYGACGIPVQIKNSLVAPIRYQLTLTVAAMEYAGQGNTQQYCSLGLQSGDGTTTGISFGDAYGGNTSPMQVQIGGNFRTPQTVTTTFLAPNRINTLYPGAAANTWWLQLKTSNFVKVTAVSLKQVPDNACLKFQATAGSPHYDHQAVANGNFLLTGTGFADGIVLDDPLGPGDTSSRIEAQNVYVRGCNRGLVVLNHAFVFTFDKSGFEGNYRHVFYGGGASDSGENCTFNHCCLFNGGAALQNDGNGEFYFTNCSIDYNQQCFLGNGTIQAVACHFEFNQVKGLSPFQAYGGAQWKIDGGQILVSGNSTGVMPSLISTASISDRIILEDVWGYNWAGVADGVMVGPGDIQMRGLLGGANSQMPAAPCNADRYNKIGPTGRFAAGITAPIYMRPGFHSGYSTATPDRNDSTITSSSGGQPPAVSGTAAMAAVSGISIPSPKGTTTALKVTRSGTFGASQSSSGIEFAVPIIPGRRHTMQGNIIFPVSQTIYPYGNPYVEVYIEASYRQSFYNDALGRPVWTEFVFPIGESKPRLYTQDGTTNSGPSTAQTTWQSFFFSDVTHWDNYDPDQPQFFGGRAPDACTHIMFYINDGNVPNAADYQITDVAVWPW